MIDKPTYRNTVNKAYLLRETEPYLNNRTIAVRCKVSPATITRIFQGQHPYWYTEELAKKGGER